MAKKRLKKYQNLFHHVDPPKGVLHRKLGTPHPKVVEMAIYKSWRITIFFSFRFSNTKISLKSRFEAFWRIFSTDSRLLGWFGSKIKVAAAMGSTLEKMILPLKSWFEAFWRIFGIEWNAVGWFRCKIKATASLGESWRRWFYHWNRDLKRFEESSASNRHVGLI